MVADISNSEYLPFYLNFGFEYEKPIPIQINEQGWHHVNSSLAGDNPVRDFFILCNLKNNERSGLLNEEKIKSV